MPLEDVALVAGTQQNLSNIYSLDIYELVIACKHRDRCIHIEIVIMHCECIACTTSFYIGYRSGVNYFTAPIMIIKGS
jgi:hypothetical protein